MRYFHFGQGVEGISICQQEVCFQEMTGVLELGVSCPDADFQALFQMCPGFFQVVPFIIYPGQVVMRQGQDGHLPPGLKYRSVPPSASRNAPWEASVRARKIWAVRRA